MFHNLCILIGNGGDGGFKGVIITGLLFFVSSNKKAREDVIFWNEKRKRLLVFVYSILIFRNVWSLSDSVPVQEYYHYHHHHHHYYYYYYYTTTTAATTTSTAITTTTRAHASYKPWHDWTGFPCISQYTRNNLLCVIVKLPISSLHFYELKLNISGKYTVHRHKAYTWLATCTSGCRDSNEMD